MVTIRAYHPNPLSLESLCFRQLTASFVWHSRSHLQHLLRCLPQKHLLDLLKLLAVLKPNNVYSKDSANLLGLTGIAGIPLHLGHVIVEEVQGSILNRCLYLSSLELARCSLHNTQFCALVKNLPNITSIDFSETYCNDEVLREVADSCFELKTLQLAWCRMVTDAGVRYLCSTQMRPHPACTKLSLINLTCTDISKRLVIDLLKSFNNLMYLYSSHTSRALCDSHYLSDTDYPSFANLCHLDNSDLSVEEFRTCLSIPRRLTSLTFQHTSDISWSDVRLVLISAGEFLTTIKLSGCTLVPQLLFQYCPLLEYVKLQSVRLIQRTTESPTFEEVHPPRSLPLQHIELINCEDLTDSILYDVISQSPAIEQIKIRMDFFRDEVNGSNISDDTFKLIKAKNDLEHLHHVALTGLYSVTMETLRTLLPPVGHTQTIFLSCCYHLPLKEVQREAKLNGWVVMR